jgi:hypothetical protein
MRVESAESREQNETPTRLPTVDVTLRKVE